MTRDEVTKQILTLNSKNLVLELPTGMGKTKQAIELMKFYRPEKVLILVPKRVLIDEWEKEIIKWYPDNQYTGMAIACYASIEKYAGNWDMVIFDEAHHLSERCAEALQSFKITRSILLSATLRQAQKEALRGHFKSIHFFKVSMREAIEDAVLPKPIIYKYPLQLVNHGITESFVKNKRAKGATKTVCYGQRFLASKDKNTKYIIKCTQQEYYDQASEMIEWYKKKFYETQEDMWKNMWLRACLDRLVWLSDIKLPVSTKISEYLHKKKCRSLIFCASIEQSDRLNVSSVHSQNRYSDRVLNMFNAGELDIISTVNCLNEGVNLVDCRAGIFNVINSSEIMTIQKVGRILRHKQPIVIIPYYMGTREEELVNRMLENIKTENIKTIFNLNSIKL
jgi:superfamily II DNA or RNA helicase